jgi:hypothetical protein
MFSGRINPSSLNLKHLMNLDWAIMYASQLQI